MNVKRILCRALLMPLLIAFSSRADSPRSGTPNGTLLLPSPAHPILDWRDVDSEDYPRYIGNLRSLGCPDQTIHDIVTAEIVGAYAERRSKALQICYQDFQYWKSDPSVTQARAAMSTERAAVDREMTTVLQQLLGADTALPDVHREWQSAELDFKLAFLPADTREQVKAILMAHEHSDQQAKQLSDGGYVSEDTNELQNIIDSHDQERGDLRALLSPEQFERVEMSVSWTSENLRRAIVHFVPTQEEFRAIFAAWKAHDEDLVVVYAARQTDLGNGEVYASIKTQLTEDRYTLYRRTWWK
jgi:hypothetical protein